MFKKLLLASLLAVPAVSMAEGLSYSYLEGSYQSLDIDGFPDIDGFGIAGSFLVGKNVFVAGDYSFLDVDGGGDLNIGNVGVGFRHGLNETVDFVAGASLVFAEAKGGGGSEDDTGYRISGGVRAALGKAELNGGLAYRDIDLLDGGKVLFTVGGLYNFTPNIAAVAGAEFEEDATAFKVGGRYNF